MTLDEYLKVFRDDCQEHLPWEEAQTMEAVFATRRPRSIFLELDTLHQAGRIPSTRFQKLLTDFYWSLFSRNTLALPLRATRGPTMIERLIDHLRKYAKLEDSIDVERFDATMSQIAGLNDPRAIGLVLPFFKDKCKFPEVMFSIIHTIEMFDAETYAREILEALPALWKQSPHWATVLHFRIFNDAPSRQAYRTQLANAGTPIKAAAKQLLTTMRERQPKFTAACDEMLGIL